MRARNAGFAARKGSFLEQTNVQFWETVGIRLRELASRALRQVFLVSSMLRGGVYDFSSLAFAHEEESCSGDNQLQLRVLCFPAFHHELATPITGS